MKGDSPAFNEQAFIGKINAARAPTDLDTVETDLKQYAGQPGYDTVISNLKARRKDLLSGKGSTGGRADSHVSHDTGNRQL